MLTRQMRARVDQAAQIFAPQAMLSLRPDGIDTLNEVLGRWGATDAHGQSWTVDSLWDDVKGRRAPASRARRTGGTLTDWAAGAVDDLDADYPEAAVAEALRTQYGLQVPAGDAHLLSLASLLISHDVLARDQSRGALSSGGQDIADLSVSAMVDRVRNQAPADPSHRQSAGARMVTRSGNSIGEYAQLALTAVAPTTAGDYTQLALDADLMPAGYDNVDLLAPRYKNLGLTREDMSDPDNDYVQRRAAEGYDDVHTALNGAATSLATSQGSRASLAQSLDRGTITVALETVARTLGEEDMEVEHAAAIVERVAASASREAVGRLIEGDASEVSDEIERVTKSGAGGEDPRRGRTGEAGDPGGEEDHHVR